ncbi:MAG: NAD(P)-dependent oxidoreductase, partial [Anaerolineae bacterium]
MDTIHVLCLGRFSDAQLERLRAVSPRLSVEQIPTQDFASIGEALTRAEVLYTFGLPPSLEQVPCLRWVQLSSAGAEHLAGHPVMSARHIHITTTSGIHAGPMAEYVMAVILAWARRLPTILELQRRREWPKGRWNVLRSLELRDAVLGIVGYGSIGREIARLASAFGMHILAMKRHPEERRDRGYIEPGLGDPDGRLPERFYGPEELHAMLGE